MAYGDKIKINTEAKSSEKASDNPNGEKAALNGLRRGREFDAHKSTDDNILRGVAGYDVVVGGFGSSRGAESKPEAAVKKADAFRDGAAAGKSKKPSDFADMALSEFQRGRNEGRKSQYESLKATRKASKRGFF